MTYVVRCGRLFVIIAIAVSVLGQAVSDRLSRNVSVLSWLVEAGLYYAVWRGQRWARWLLVFLMGLSPVVGFYFLRVSPTLPIVVYLLYPLLVAAMLALPPSVSAFLNFQRDHPLIVITPAAPPSAPSKHVDPY